MLTQPMLGGKTLSRSCLLCQPLTRRDLPSQRPLLLVLSQYPNRLVLGVLEMPSVTLSSVGSAVLPCDYLAAKGTTVGVSFSSSTSSAAYQLQATLDDPMRVTSPTWFNVSTTTYTSSTNFDLPTIMQILTPVAGVRINSTGLSAGSITLRAIQNVGG